jgi:antibiotic biosynthesis monooxygenase (ABM) superfamily enzyme
MEVTSAFLELDEEIAALWEALPGLIGRVLIRPPRTHKEMLEGLKDPLG